MEFQVGDCIPDLVLLNEDEQEVFLRKIIQDKGLIIFAYPKANTPGCTKQGCGFRDNYPKLMEANYEVLGVSYDSCRAQKNFKTKQNFPFHLLSDREGTLIQALGARKPDGKLFRSHWVFERGTGKCLKKCIGVKPLESVEDVISLVTK
ncbi:thioredoxin peroxidase [Schizosaccharomyces japonicus yFS275]|uniref:thioredoxin-dependent peroxiredoxin n=1 Tax=Schizosaccharomyces japonicus (strain yFS275 / FY16936) TaxID=402676 RepID=B6K2P9_SCHJY|nr:thioredoxin peroxidase [Schizosaccharomyces japonicus yFS275]EEB07430.1 thioredoxin peroxidase [Schizosaccharomyces japonicus yFS275]